MRRIKKLDEELIKRISAGEVIVRPINIIKELLENALDSGADQIQIDINNLLKIQIRDNGCGIEKEDLLLLCERHATSKIESFSDLSTLSSFGFRGEALSSISTISKVKVITKTKNNQIGYVCEYRNSVPVSEPSCCSSTTGTTIVATDLFYNAPERKGVLKSMAEEYLLILGLVQKYAIKSAGVSISCKRVGKEPDLSIVKTDTAVNRIRAIYGKELATQILPLFVSNTEFVDFSVEGFATTSSFSGKRSVFIFFVNQRLVEIELLKRAIANTYREEVLSKTNPFVFLSITIEPRAVDVNVHPTKNKVTFLYEKEISMVICDSIRQVVFFQSETPSVATQTVFKDRKEKCSVPKRETPSKKVRVDNKERQIQSKMALSLNSMTDSLFSSVVSDDVTKDEKNSPLSPQKLFFDDEAIDKKCVLIPEFICFLRDKKKEEVESIVQRILYESVFIGVINRKYAAIQHGIGLYLVDYRLVIEEFLLNKFLLLFGNVTTQRLSSPIELQSFSEEQKSHSFDCLIEHRLMLKDYFGIEITKEGVVCGMPLVLNDYLPSSIKTGQFFIQMAKEIDLTSETCLEELLNRLSRLYTPSEENEVTEDLHCLITEKFYFEIKTTALDTFYSSKLYGNDVFQKVCDTKDLYKTFCR